MTLAMGAVVGLVAALVIQLLLSQVFISRDTSGWTWFLTAIGGIAVGGALTLFLYGVSTERTDTGPKPRGRADVSTEGEDRKSRRRRHAAEPR
jgi:H+/Cl- antiporter ClcA